MKKYSVRLTLIFSVLSLILMLFGLGWTIQNQFFSNEASGAIEQQSQLKMFLPIKTVRWLSLLEIR
ncbi:hypothetical protein [Mesobacillus boroniphilus]|uniref:Uncharacterized protein n=1 Tax=Mesobacillus boroniphilus JCM 21738 TaxID=1294265 RepID=W4RKI4_9BACI|nr:hypothetical protein [Mesobacillus boroniphilus]GAE44831.1 hypothetical protein JCM21738_1578 [Mesobacillus boroniphilus JCM 21738]